MKQKEEVIRVYGIVKETLLNAIFPVEIEGGHIVLGHASGTMWMNYIPILPGDRVALELSPYHPSRQTYGGFSHKLFTHFDHTIATYGRAAANIGLGSEIEFGRQAGPPPAIGDDKCINCALSCWGVWLKGCVSW